MYINLYTSTCVTSDRHTRVQRSNRIYIAFDSSKIRQSAIKKVCRHTINNHCYIRCLKPRPPPPHIQIWISPNPTLSTLHRPLLKPTKPKLSQKPQPTYNFPKKTKQSFLTQLKMSPKLSILKPSVNLLHQSTSHSPQEYQITDFAFTSQIKILSNK